MVCDLPVNVRIFDRWGEKQFLIIRRLYDIVHPGDMHIVFDPEAYRLVPVDLDDNDVGGIHAGKRMGTLGAKIEIPEFIHGPGLTDGDYFYILPFFGDVKIG
jgi:hypothetical protein